MKHSGHFVKLTYCLTTLLISSLFISAIIATVPSQRAKSLKFNPPLKGTEILLEADLPESPQRRRGIWALDPKTGKVRFLIPNGSRPIWSPKRNYFAYREHAILKVIDKKGEVKAAISPSKEDAQLIGWGHNEEWILYTEYVGERIEGIDPLESFHEYVEDFVLFKTVTFVHFNPKEHPLNRLLTRGWLIILEVFPSHHVGNASVSPNGKYIAFEVFKYVPGIGKLNSKIALGDLVKRNECLVVENIRRLTSLPSELMEINPKWSPDSKQIAFEIVDPGKGSRIAHVINLDGSGLKGLKLYRGETILGGRRKFLRIEEGLVTESYMKHDLRILDWLPDNRLVVVESKFKLTRHVDRLDDRFISHKDTWIVDLEQRHPPLVIYVFYLFGAADMDKFLLLSPDRKQLVGMKGFDEYIFSFKSLNIPEPQNKDAMRIYPHIAFLKPPPHWADFTLLSNNLAVYWVNW